MYLAYCKDLCFNLSATVHEFCEECKVYVAKDQARHHVYAELACGDI